MSITTTHTQAAPASSTRGQRTALLWVGGSVAALGAIVALAGAALLIVFGADGRLSSGPETVNTTTSALVTESAHIEDTASVADALGTVSVSVSAEAQGDHGVFVGVGPTADVDRYLSGAAVDRVTDIDVDPFRLTRDTRSGTAVPAPPAEQSFWVTQSGGRTSADVDWKIRDGSYRLVVMNADGTPRVATQSRFAITVPHLPAISWGIVAFGVLVVGSGALLIVLGRRRRAA